MRTQRHMGVLPYGHTSRTGSASRQGDVTQNGGIAVRGGPKGDEVSVGIRPSALSQLDFRVDGFEFAASLVDLHLPVDAALSAVDVI